ncbi:tRNA 5-methoxyuridine(34)/uridine 5-oxyacetic acid(34) synthase CmoB [Alteromonas sp. C1M14]|uniref:tRNA 5-methoxyuridine(34)/uridine 5-oxyacetic acid(34) synthase CmoB n=1 Tax=Alteromonas sp. C1M14 TaxID=2841567 RepID=UPI001C07EEFF|nr:tRNA 5-methoxyuridine(34)/uridine 5-oxyacetic acid(34) synthase CmoB [Alteromonas sp. C1M14]MBU2976778.1 tRNA 5-methoxyuridine(34)/uridine 5-oxyacetic acid(34) synthase CmoB [Alteromonas sp. C1M14]
MPDVIEQWFNDCYRQIIGSPLSSWIETLPVQLAHWRQQGQHGELAKWCRLLAKLPHVQPSVISLTDKVQVGVETDLTEYQRKQLEGLLKQFAPWRKGPFWLYGIHIDTEWRSDWKWDRVLPHISDLKNRQVLDVGCGSGYHMWRMLAHDPAGVFGIDPSQLFLIQFQAIKHFHPDPRIHFLPLGIEHMPQSNEFDTVFSMGVLYHRKDPMLFLQQLKNQLRKGGELVLETLVVDGDERTVLMAGERYAQMRNVWFLPSVAALTVWLGRLGFINIHVADISVTTIDEQRTTSWMTSQSLQDFLDPNDPTLTIEGYPAPQRAVIVATKK